MSCPNCGNVGMLFEGHNGMEHNVCQNCGTVIECSSFTVDSFQKGFQSVPSDYGAKPSSHKYGRNPKSKAFVKTKDLMTSLMDRLQLPTSVKETAFYFFQHSRYLDKLGSIGACIYLAMKHYNIPITIRYLSNYLQVSHFTIGRMMKKLEKRIGVQEPVQSGAFDVKALVLLIFNQAQFGDADGGKERMKLMIEKTEKLVELLQDCQATTGCEPHLMILAAGYIVWRHLISHNWLETVTDDNAHMRAKWTVKKISAFLAEMKVTLSAPRAVHSKVNMIINLLYKFSQQIPWIASRSYSKDIIFYNLDDFLNNKSQIIELTAQDLSKESNESKKEEDEVKLYNLCEGERASETSALTKASSLEVAELAGKSNFKINNHNDAASDVGNTITEPVFHIDLSEMVHDPTVCSKQNESIFKKVKYTKVTDAMKANFQNLESNDGTHFGYYKESNTSGSSYVLNGEDLEGSNGLNQRNGYFQLMKLTHPYFGRVRNRKSDCKSAFNPDLTFS